MVQEHDSSYRQFFSSPLLVRELLEAVGGATPFRDRGRRGVIAFCAIVPS